MSALTVDGMVCVLVGNFEKPFHVYSKLLTSNSVFFENALSGSFIESSTRSIPLEDASAELFAAAVQFWSCGAQKTARGRLPTKRDIQIEGLVPNHYAKIHKDANRKALWRDLTSLWLMADMLQSRRLQDSVAHLLVDLLVRFKHLNPPVSVVDTAGGEDNVTNNNNGFGNGNIANGDNGNGVIVNDGNSNGNDDSANAAASARNLPGLGLPSMGTVKHVYANTIPTSPMRKLIVEAFVCGGSADILAASLDQLPLDFAHGVLVGLARVVARHRVVIPKQDSSDPDTKKKKKKKKGKKQQGKKALKRKKAEEEMMTPVPPGQQTVEREGRVYETKLRFPGWDAQVYNMLPPKPRAKPAGPKKGAKEGGKTGGGKDGRSS